MTLIHDARTHEHKIHMTYLPLAFKLFSKGMLSMFENFFKDHEFDRSFDDLKIFFFLNVMFCSKKVHAGKEVCVNGTCSLNTEKRITAFYSIII